MGVNLPAPHVQVSWGELIDKITILEIKLTKLDSSAALANVRRELHNLSVAASAATSTAGLAPLTESLRTVNGKLWEVENQIRETDARGCFGKGFVSLARSVYLLNDERAALKKSISLLLNSEFIEEKSYWTAGQSD